MPRTALLLSFLALLLTPDVGAQSIRGRLLEAETGAPIDAGTVVLLSRDGVPIQDVLTDRTGAFLLEAPDPGAYRLQARRLGYLPATTALFELEDADTVEVEYRLSAQAIALQPLTVVAHSRRPAGLLRGFYERAERGGFGTFITRDQIEERHPVHASDLLRTVPGVQLFPTWWGGALVLMRGSCVPRIYLDGMPIRTTSIDDLVSPVELEGVEVYRSAVEAPAELTGSGSSCGVVALWTRRGS